MAYPPSDLTQSIDALEKQLLATWKHERLFTRVSDATRYGPPFIFFEGPPTANGRPGIHHVFSRTLKDLICRFHTMLGQGVTRIAGWDTHGLPVEIEVEKALNISGKREIEAYGVERFNKLSRESVFKYKTDWESLSDRIGYWLDYEHPYVTYSNNYIETVWWLLKRLHEKALLYRGHKVLPYCPRCGTALSSHKVAQGYETLQTNSVYVTFPLLGRKGDTPRELVIWTTTPWTLLSNVAVAVHPDLDYGEYALDDQTSGKITHYIVAVARAGDVHVHGRPLSQGKLIKTYVGRDLVGKKYARPLEVVPLPDEGQRAVIVAGAFVSADEGTGLVHMAPAFGADDYVAGQQNGLAFVNPVVPDGTFKGTTWPEIEGKLVTDKETNRLIIERLKQEGRWLETRPYSHSYPHCWRCDSPLIYYARSAWFDSGSMPYAQWHYPFEHEADFKAHFPADYICEGVDQTRGWFYSLLAIGVTAFDSQIYKHVIVNDHVLDVHGQKMSKSRGNIVDPWKVIGEHGADAVRLYLIGQSQVWLPKRFDERQIPEIAGGFLNTLRSTYDFFRRYAQDWNPPAEENATPARERPAADRWLLARLDEVVASVRQSWSPYDVTTGVRSIMDCVGEDLSRRYGGRRGPGLVRPVRYSGCRSQRKSGPGGRVRSRSGPAARQSEFSDARQAVRKRDAARGGSRRGTDC